MLFKEFITESFSVFLLEYNRAKTIETWGEKLEKRIQSSFVITGDISDTINEKLEMLEKADPTQNKQYVQWLIKAFVNGSSLQDLMSRGKDNLEKFELLKKRKLIKPEHADIGKLKLLKNLEDIMGKYEIPEEENTDKGDSSVIEDNQEFKAVVPHDQKAACYYGQGTRWCTAAKNHNMFKDYNDKNDLIIIIPKKPRYDGEKYQLYYNERNAGDEIFMDEKDEYVVESWFIERFSITHEDITKLFAKALSGDDMKDIQKNETIKRLKSKKLTPQRAFDMLYKNDYSDQDTQDLERILIKDIKLTKKYLDRISHSDWKRSRSWSDFEKNLLIQGNQENIVLFADGILGKRWPEAEKFLLSDPRVDSLCGYATDVMGKRWPEAEKAMLKLYSSEIHEPNDNGYFMARYAQNVMKAHWLEFEEIILKLKDYETADYYIQKSADFKESPNYEKLEQLAK